MAQPTTYGQSYPLSLPSGNKVRVRRGSILTRARNGLLPAGLISTVWKTFGEAAGAVPTVQTDADIGTVLGMMDACVQACLVEPRAVAEGDTAVTVDTEGFTTGQVHLADIPDLDKALIFGFFQGTVKPDAEEVAKTADLSRFRGESAGEAPGDGGQPVQPAAVESPAPAA